MATESSTAAPNVMASPPAPATDPSPKITLLSTSVRINKAAIATVLILPRFVIPITIHKMISAPITRHHTHLPV